MVYVKIKFYIMKFIYINFDMRNVMQHRTDEEGDWT